MSSARWATFNIPVSGVFRPLLLFAAINALGAGSVADAKMTPALAAFDQAWKGVSAYNATITIFERDGSRTQSMVFDYRFTKPSSIAVRVAAGANKGATLAWGGGSTVVVRRGSGFLSLFRRTVPLK